MKITPRFIEIGDLLSTTFERTQNAITVFDSTGLASQDVAIATLVYDLLN